MFGCYKRGRAASACVCIVYFNLTCKSLLQKRIVSWEKKSNAYRLELKCIERQRTYSHSKCAAVSVFENQCKHIHIQTSTHVHMWANLSLYASQLSKNTLIRDHSNMHTHLHLHWIRDCCIVYLFRRFSNTIRDWERERNVGKLLCTISYYTLFFLSFLYLVILFAIHSNRTNDGPNERNHYIYWNMDLFVYATIDVNKALKE